MELWQAIVLGVVEGITEYLPVSSTGHLLITQALLGIAPSEAANAFAIAIQAGAIVAVLGAYRSRIAQMCAGLLGKNPLGLKLVLRLLVAFVPAAIIGVLCDDAIESVLFGPWPVVAAWAFGGLFLLFFARKLRNKEGIAIENVEVRIAVIIGLAQCLALWPGVSRSLATIAGALFCGLSMGAAIEFSFLLGLLTLGAATSYKALGSGELLLATYGPLPLFAGFVTAWLSAQLSVRWLLNWLQNHGLGLFGWWRIIAASIVAVLLLGGVI